jgi:PleD family two-component response regulator
MKGFNHIRPMLFEILQSLLIRADEALYGAKTTGRNRIEMSDSALTT